MSLRFECSSSFRSIFKMRLRPRSSLRQSLLFSSWFFFSFFSHHQAWLTEIHEYAQEDVVLMLLGNKARHCGKCFIRMTTSWGRSSRLVLLTHGAPQSMFEKRQTEVFVLKKKKIINKLNIVVFIYWETLYVRGWYTKHTEMQLLQEACKKPKNKIF